MPARKLVEQIRRQIPTAIVDWEAGERKVSEQLEQLIALDAPSIICDNHRQLRSGNYAEVRIAYREWPGREVVGYVGSDTSDLGGSHFEIVGDFDVDLLKRAAKDLSMAIADYIFILICENKGLDAWTYSGGIDDVAERVHMHNPSYRDNGETVEIHPRQDWKHLIRHSVAGWLRGGKWGSGHENILRDFPSPEAFAEAAVKELSAIGAVRRAWSYESPGFHFGIMLDHADREKREWVTMIDLLGVAKEFVKG